MNHTLVGFINELSSNSPVPGGGGASALMGAIGVSLCSMVANLTIVNNTHVQYREDLERIVSQTEVSIKQLLILIDKDAQVFEPLSVAYKIPKDTPNRNEILESALLNAASIPMEMLILLKDVICIIEEIAIKGSKLAISDVGIAASACKSALEGAALNVFINTKLMKNKEQAARLNSEANDILDKACKRCDVVYQTILCNLRSPKS